MTPTRNPTAIEREFEAAGIARTARKGFISMMFGIMGAMLLFSWTFIFYLQKTHAAEIEVYIKIIDRMHDERADTKLQTDSIVRKN